MDCTDACTPIHKHNLHLVSLAFLCRVAEKGIDALPNSVSLEDLKSMPDIEAASSSTVAGLGSGVSGFNSYLTEASGWLKAPTYACVLTSDACMSLPFLSCSLEEPAAQHCAPAGSRVPHPGQGGGGPEDGG